MTKVPLLSLYKNTIVILSNNGLYEHVFLHRNSLYYNWLLYLISLMDQLRAMSWAKEAEEKSIKVIGNVKNKKERNPKFIFALYIVIQMYLLRFSRENRNDWTAEMNKNSGVMSWLNTASGTFLQWLNW